MEQTNFLDRVSTYPGRKKIKIVSQTADTILADVEFADEPSVEGTPINATVMSRFQQGIVDANTMEKEFFDLVIENFGDVKNIFAKVFAINVFPEPVGPSIKTLLFSSSTSSIDLTCESPFSAFFCFFSIK